ncbi:non-ribosomal peptide synthetase [Williamsia limnetica]|uniref:non-ribosomal peptide synthetase n=1 Tax=Williamsia limnetica TaxID=882452 RepID=UPI00131423E2|nr:non-ribosomal peptide synthetase [Williamsia limnetica]
MSLVVHPEREDPPAWAGELRCVGATDVNDLADVFEEASTVDQVVWSTGNPFIFRKPILDLELTILNVHGGPLPFYRGLPMAGAVHAILNGETSFGVTIHRVDKGIDTGAIVEQSTFDLPDDITLEELTLTVSQQCHDIFVSAFDAAKTTGGLRPAADAGGSDPTAGSYFGMRQLATIGTLRNHENFARATFLGVLTDHYRFYAILFDFARGGKDDLTSVIADLRYWLRVGQTTTSGAPIPGGRSDRSSGPRTVERVERIAAGRASVLVRDAAQRIELPVTAVLTGAVAAAVSEITGDRALTLALPVREEAGWVPLRIELPGNHFGEEVVVEVQRAIGEAARHASIPFTEIVDALDGTDGVSSRPQLTVSCVSRHDPGSTNRHEPPQSYRFDAVEQRASDIELVLRLDDDQIGITCVFAADVVERHTVDRLLGQIETALPALAEVGVGGSGTIVDLDAAVAPGIAAEVPGGTGLDLLERFDAEAGVHSARVWRWVRDVEGVSDLPTPVVVDAFVRCVRAFGYHGGNPTAADLRAQIHLVDRDVLDAPVSPRSVHLLCGPATDDVSFSVVAAGDIDATAVDVFAETLVTVATALAAGDRVHLHVPDCDSLLRQRSDRSGSAEILDSAYWMDFADNHSDREFAGIDADAQAVIGASEVSSSLAVEEITASVLGWLGVHIGAVVTGGVVIDVEQSARGSADLVLPGRITTRYPVVLEDLGSEAIGAGPGVYATLRDAGIVPADLSTAMDYALLYWDNDQTLGIFDDVPDAAVLVRVAEGEAAIRVPDADGEHWGRYAVVVTVVRGPATADGNSRRLQVVLQSRSGIEFDVDALCRSLEFSTNDADVTSDAADAIAAAVTGVVTVEAVRPPLVGLTDPEIAVLSASFGEIRDILPLSPLQEGFYYHLQMANESGETDLYASQSRSRVRGSLDTDRMTDAISELLTRNENLTAGFVTIGGRAVQVIPETVPIPVRVVRADGASVDPGGLEEALAEERSAPFIADRPPLIRFLLLETEPGDWIISITFEHLLFDGWSLALLWDELFALYGDLAGLSVPNRPAYRDYLRWLGDRERAVAEQSWSEYLDLASGGIESTIVAPRALGTSAAADAAADSYRYLDPELHSRITAACREVGVTIGTYLHVAWGITLARLTGRTDAVFGTSVSGRPPELGGSESIIGLLFNTVPVHVRAPQSASVRRVLTDHQSRSAAVLDAAHVPLTDTQRIAGSSQLFDTLFIIQNMPVAVTELGESFGPDGSQISADEFALDDSTHYPLSIAVYPGDEVRVRCSYRGDVYTPAEVETIIDRLIHTAEAMVADLEGAVGRIGVTVPAELELLRSWNDTSRPVAAVTIAELLVEQAERTPDETAVVAGETQLSYAELLLAAGRCAAILGRHGVRVEDRVALLLRRDERTVVALFGVLLAGAAYVPIDSEHPDERIEYILDAAAPTVVLTTTDLRTRIPADRAHTVIDLDSSAVATELAAAHSDPVSPVPVSLDNLAYVIFTSGSTGRPKGVAVGHRGLTNMYFNHVRKIFDPVVRHQRGRRMRIAHTTSFSFDASWEQLFWLLNGHQVHIIDDELRKDPRLLLEHYDLARVDGFDVTPSYGQILTEEGLLDRPRPAGASTDETDPGVVFVSLGGEAVPESLWTELRTAPGVESFNLYGPTEYTINALGADLADSPTSNAGTPIDNTRAYVLDTNLALTPPGTPGELYLAGAGLARGYFSRSALTSERFVADPFDNGGRLYRTGDLVSWRPDGQIDYLGRTDDQIKIRGFRVELGEIAETIRAAPGVSAATVVAVDTGHDRKDIQLAAYYSSPQALDDNDIRAHTAQRLPQYMVPASFTHLTTLPLTTNGKINHAALPAPEFDLAGGEILEPTTETERRLRAIVALVIDADMDPAKVSVAADFVDIGIDSLRLTRLASRINAEFDITLTLRPLIENPTVSTLGAVVADLVGAETASRVRVSDVIRPEVIPASFGQQSLWLMDQMSGPTDQYIVPIVVPLVGEVDIPALAAAIGDVVIRHESLRTLLVADDRVVVRQEIVPPAAISERLLIDIVDGSGWDPSRVHTVLREQMLVPFSLGVDLPIRALLIETGDGAVMGLGVHHSALDEWSIPAMHRDMVAGYLARTAGAAPVWEPLTTQYADYAVWQRQLLGRPDDESSVLARQLQYWRGTLDGVPSLSAIPADLPRPASPNWWGQWREDAVPASVVPGLREVARQQGLTMFMLTQAAVALAVSSAGAGDDVVLGAPVGGRTDEALTDLVGYFVNTLPLRYDLSGNPTLGEVLGRVRATVLAGFEHQEVPFEEVVRAVGAERGESATPLFQMMVTYREDGDTAGRFAPGIDFGKAQRIALSTVKSDAELYITVAGDNITIVAGYAGELYEQATVQRFTDILIRAFEVLSDDVEVPLAAADLLSGRERSRLAEWSRGDRARDDAADTDTLDDALAAQAAATSESTAIVFGDRVMTYGEFDALVNQLSRLLLDRGVRVGDRVAVLLPRSEWLPIALTAVVRAGAAYVPVDASYPQERINYLLADSAPAVIVSETATTGGELADLFGPDIAQVILDDPATRRELSATSSAPVTDRDRSRRLLAHDAAYLIYTSGTTGKPKGATITHRAILNRLRWMQNEYGLSGEDRVLQKTPFSFDVSVWEFFWPLISGATMVVAAPDGHKDPEYLAAAISRHRISTLHFVPSMLAAFLESSPVGERLRSVKRVFCSGEALPASTASDAVALFGDNIHNLYGPTEAAIDVTFQPVTRALLQDLGGAGVPIGAPVANTDAWVLDRLLRPVPAGVAGELYLGGVQLAREYHDRPGLTAGRFVANPRSGKDNPGSRLYRTGDVARWNSQGKLEYLGRTDFQVKIRGFRIELDEIRTTLETHRAVGSAVVVARSRESGDPYLAAYYTRGAVGGLASSGDASPPAPATTGEELQAFLSDLLPEHMIPVTYTELETLPVTDNGKLDRSKLPEPAIAADEMSGPSPRSDREKQIATAMADVLGFERDQHLGIDRSFFALGGDSIIGVKLVSRLRAEGTRLSLRDVFAVRTIRLLALASDDNEFETESTPNGSGLPELDEETSRGLLAQVSPATAELLPLSPLQQGLYFQSMFGEAGSSVYIVQNYFDFDREFELERLASAVQLVIDRTPALRMRVVVDDDGVAYQAVLDSVRETIRSVDLSHRPAGTDPDTGALFAQEKSALHDIVGQPLWQLTVIALPEGRTRILITHHFLCFDGASAFILADRIVKTYASIGAEGSAAGLPALTPDTGYRDFLLWNAGRDRDASKKAWQQILRGQEAGSLLAPGATPRAGASERLALVLDKHGSDAVRDRAQSAGVTMNTVLNAALAVVLAHRLGSDRVVFGTPNVLRPPEIDGIDSAVGLFMNTVPIAVSLDPDETLTDLFGRLQDERADVLSHEYLGLGQIQQAVGSGPLFDVLFTLRNAWTDAGDVVVEHGITAGGTLDDSHYPLSIAINPFEQIEVTIDFREPDVSRAVAQEVLDSFRNVLTALSTAPPTTPVGSLEVFRERLLCGLERDVTDRTVAELLDEQARADPDAIALVAGDERVSFRQLNCRVNVLARALIARGVGPERVVGLALPRSVDMVVALFAVLRTGGAYLPLELDYPSERIRAMLADASPVLVVSTSGCWKAQWSPEIVPDSGVMLLDDPRIDEEMGASDTGSLSADELQSFRGLGNSRMDVPAYVIYTSGSTGVPKGVVTAHRGLTNMVINHREAIFDPVIAQAGHRKLRVAHTVSFSFDMSWEELLWLLEGHEVHICDEELRRDGSALVKYCHDHAVDVVNVTPTYAHHLFEMGLLDDDKRAPVLVLLGGEAVSDGVWERLRPDRGVTGYNLYGPTEYTINALGAGTGDSPTPTVGRPIANTVAHVLDAWLRPVPRGVVGELYLSGPGLARGYLDRFAVTAGRFVADPAISGNRMYRTGDLVRLRDDGHLDFLGRSDDQVKIRGHRVELGEVNAVISGCPGVAQCAVLVQSAPDGTGPAEAGSRMLVAHLVMEPEWASTDGDSLSAARQVRDRIAATLPGYMVPTLWSVVTALPMTVNGKLDTGALPDPKPLGAQSLRSPRTATESALCGLFAEVLSVDEVGIGDDFFDFGGDSISSLTAASRARKRGFALKPGDIMQLRTVEAIAEKLDAEHEPAPATRTAELAADAVGSAPSTPIVEGYLTATEGRDGFYQALVLATPSDATRADIGKMLQGVLDTHHALRARCERIGDRTELVIGEAGTVTGASILTVAACTGDPAEHRDACLTNAVRDLDPWAGVVIRAVWIPAATGTPVGGELVLAIHHLVVDGVSWRVLTEDLADMWSMIDDGRAPKPAPEGTNWRAWSRSYVEHIRKGGFSRELPYWKHVLAAEVATIGRPPTASADPEAAVTSELVIPAEIAGPILMDLPRILGGEVNDVLLTALAVSIDRWRSEIRSTAPGPVSITLEGHGREESVVEGVDLSRTVGWFTTLFPVSLEPGSVRWAGSTDDGSTPDPRDLRTAFSSVSAALRTVPDKGIGYGSLRSVHAPEHIDVQQNSEILFNYLGRLDTPEEAAPWEVVPGTSLRFGAVERTVMGRRLEINAISSRGDAGPELRFTFTCPESFVSGAEVEQLQRSWHEVCAGLAALVTGDVDNLSERTPPAPVLAEVLESGFDYSGFFVPMLVEIPANITFDNVCEAFTAVAGAHPVLRSAVAHDAANARWWHTFGVPDDFDATPLFSVVDARGLDEADLIAAEAWALADSGERVRPTDGLMCALTYFDRGEQPARLLVAISHLVVDAMSWQILLGDLAAACEDLAAGLTPTPVLESTSFRQWSARLATRTLDVSQAAVLAQWQSYSRKLRVDGTTPLAAALFGREADADETARTLQTLIVEPDITEALTGRIPRHFGAVTGDILLTALLIAVSQTVGEEHRQTHQRLVLQGHGRAEALLDGGALSSTVGYFAESYPAVVRIGRGPDSAVGEAFVDQFGDALECIQADLAEVPEAGEGFSYYRRLLDVEPTVFTGDEIAFNYEGRFEGYSAAAWGLAPEEREALSAHTEKLAGKSPLSSIARVVGPPGSATMSLGCSSPGGALSREVVASIVERWRSILEDVVAQSSSKTSSR